MSDEAAFLDAILARPDDLTARLVYADWLDDRGDPRAGYLRLGVLLAESPPGANRVSVRDRMHELQSRFPSWWLAVVGFSAAPQRPIRACLQRAAKVLGRTVRREANGSAVTIEAAAVSGLTGAVAFLEAWSKRDVLHSTYHLRLSDPAGREASYEPYTFNPRFGCDPQFLEWYGDEALLIYQTEHRVYACRLGFGGPAASRKLFRSGGWRIDGRELGFREYGETQVRRLSVPDLTELPPLTEDEASERDLLPPGG